MENEQSLIKVKLNIIDKITIRLTIRNLERAIPGHGYKIWSEIKNDKVKFIPEILELAWSKTTSVGDYKKFPTYFQEGKAKEVDKNSIKFLSIEAQHNIIKKDEQMLSYVEENVRNSFLKENPAKCEKYYKWQYKNIEEILDLKENPEIILALQNETQKYFVTENPDYIYYCNKEVQKEILSTSEISNPIWKNVIKNDQSITLKKWIKYFIISSSSENKSDKGENAKNRKNIKRYIRRSGYDERVQSSLRDGIEDLLNFCEIETQKSIINEIESLKEEENKELIIEAFSDLLRTKSLSISQEKEILPILFNNEEIIGRKYFDIEWWDLQTINDNFLERFGKEKFEAYKNIIEQMKQGNISSKNSNRILRLFFKEETIINNVEPEKIIEYIKMYDEYIENKEKYEKMVQKPVSLIAEERNVKKYFKEIMKDAFGEEALKIIEKRPGLNLFNISNTEIFNENIINNFSNDFIDDCLSYNFKNYDSWLKMMKNKEDLDAFKFYFDITSQRLGANVITMQRCMSRYNEFRSLLIDARVNENMKSDQKENIIKLCMWPLNICNVEKVEDLEDIDKKLQIKLKGLDEDEKTQFAKKIKDDIENIGTDVDKTIYNLESREVMTKSGLTKEEIDLFEFLEKSKLTSEERMSYLLSGESGLYITTERIIESAEHSDTLGIFLNKYSGIKKIKDNQMEELNGQFTNMEKIDEAIENGKYGVKKIEIDGFTYVDLGEMPVSFASHNPIMNNSELSHMPMAGGLISQDGLAKYLDYEEEDGISTISARPVNNTIYNVRQDVEYIYWNLQENEVINLTNVDGNVSHKGKMVQVSSGRGKSISIKDYRSISESDSINGEIAFYRRRREHKKKENQKYGRKIIPDAAINVSEYEVLKRFEKPIIIIVKRGTLNENNVEKYKQIVQQRIKEAKERIEKEIYDDKGR